MADMVRPDAPGNGDVLALQGSLGLMVQVGQLGMIQGLADEP